MDKEAKPTGWPGVAMRIDRWQSKNLMCPCGKWVTELYITEGDTQPKCLECATTGNSVPVEKRSKRSKRQQQAVQGRLEDI